MDAGEKIVLNSKSLYYNSSKFFLHIISKWENMGTFILE